MARPAAFLVLADGTAFPGEAIGALGDAVGEVVFNTAITGYQECITDPSALGQLIAFTYPHLGNCGVNPDDNESGRAQAAGVICTELDEPFKQWRSRQSLDSWMTEQGLCGICGVDTRALTLRLRERGSQNACISSADVDPTSLRKKAQSILSIAGQNLAENVGCREAYQFAGGHSKIVAVLDLGVKRSTLRAMEAAGFNVLVYPAMTPAETIMNGASAVMIAGGPGDAAPCAASIETCKNMLGRVPLLGLGLGHLIVALALGGRTVKMPFGHRGGNQAVREETTGRILVTTQNHSFCVASDSLPPEVTVTHRHVNDNTVEGLSVPARHAFSIQHQSGAPTGSNDILYPFNELSDLIARFEKVKKNL